MDFKAVAVAEADFKARGNAAGVDYELTPFSIPIPGDDNHKLDGITCRPKDGFSGYFYDEKFTKEKIVLHFTVGHLKGDIYSLSNKSRGHVSTAFVLGRSGMVFQLFSSAAWSYHLGRNSLGGNAVQSKISLGIEISNYGPLTKKGNNLETAYSSSTRKDVYCTLGDTDQYVKLPKSYRGYQYYTAFTNEQYHSLILLLRYLTATYQIPRQFVGEDSRFETTSAGSANFKGICSHVNFRKDKCDIGPAFDWDRVIAGVTAENYGGNPLEDDVKKAEAKVEEAKQAVQAANAALTTSEAELVAAQDALDAADVTSRDASIIVSEDKIADVFPKAEGTDKEYSEDGPEPFDIDLTPFYV
jgi:N-acetyl-anhydromuramyl-L-alanine amidase AmpD